MKDKDLEEARTVAWTITDPPCECGLTPSACREGNAIKTSLIHAALAHREEETREECAKAADEAC